MQTRRDVLTTAATGITTMALGATSAAARGDDEHHSRTDEQDPTTEGYAFEFLNAHAVRSTPELPESTQQAFADRLDDRVGDLRIDPADVTALATGDDYLAATGSFSGITIRLAMLFGNYDAASDHGAYRVYESPTDAVAFTDGELFRTSGPLSDPEGVRKTVDVALGDTDRGAVSRPDPHDEAVTDILATLSNADVVVGRRLTADGAGLRGLGSATAAAVGRTFSEDGTMAETYVVGFDRPGAAPLPAFERHVERNAAFPLVDEDAGDDVDLDITEKNGCVVATATRAIGSVHTVTPSISDVSPE